MNVLLHIANTLLLFTVLRMMTGAMWRSAFAAAVFALHPLHVESVAWVAERKDVLSTLFWMLTMISYVQYVRRNSKGWYAVTLVLFAMGLMSKPMLVTLPMQQTLEEVLGEPPDPEDDWLSLFQAMSVSTAQFLMELTRLLGDDGRIALRSWWQGRLITLLREESTSRRRKRGSTRRKKGADVPRAFQDLIRGLDMGGLGADEDGAESG